MTIEIPTEFKPFVQRMIAKQRFRTEEEVVRESLRMMLEQEEIDDKLLEALDSLDRGLGVPAEQVYAAAEEVIAKAQCGER